MKNHVKSDRHLRFEQNERAMQRAWMTPGKGHRVNWLRRLIRAVLSLL